MTLIKTNRSCWTKRERTARIMLTKLLHPQPLHPPVPKALLYFVSSHNYLCNSALQEVAELRQQHPLAQTGWHHAVRPLTLHISDVATAILSDTMHLWEEFSRFGE